MCRGVPQMNDRYAEILNHFYPQDDRLTSNLWPHSYLYSIYHKCKKSQKALIWYNYSNDAWILPAKSLIDGHVTLGWIPPEMKNSFTYLYSVPFLDFFKVFPLHKQTAGEVKVDEKIAESLVGSSWQKIWCSRDVHHFLSISFFFLLYKLPSKSSNLKQLTCIISVSVHQGSRHSLTEYNTSGFLTGNYQCFS